MSALSKVLRAVAGDRLMFHCPGCDTPHLVHHGHDSGPRWTWNGDAERPTFEPSILVRWDQWEPSAVNAEISRRIVSGEIVQIKVAKVCHSFVRDGRIQFLSDCTHALAGQTVPLPEWTD